MYLTATTEYDQNSRHLFLTFERLAGISRLASEHACLPPVWRPTPAPLILIISCCPFRGLRGSSGDDSTSDIFMSVTEPSVSLRYCVKVADVTPLCLMDGGRLWIAVHFYLLRQANPSGSRYNQLDPLLIPSNDPPQHNVHLFILNVR